MTVKGKARTIKGPRAGIIFIKKAGGGGVEEEQIKKIEDEQRYELLR